MKKLFATMYNEDGYFTCNCRLTYATSKKAAAELLKVKVRQVYIY